MPRTRLTNVRLLRLRANCALTRGPGCGLATLPVQRMRRTRSDGTHRADSPLARKCLRIAGVDIDHVAR
jgi:hypothetical protein